MLAVLRVLGLCSHERPGRTRTLRRIDHRLPARWLRRHHPGGQEYVRATAAPRWLGAVDRGVRRAHHPVRFLTRSGRGGSGRPICDFLSVCGIVEPVSYKAASAQKWPTYFRRRKDPKSCRACAVKAIAPRRAKSLSSCVRTGFSGGEEMSRFSGGRTSFFRPIKCLSLSTAVFGMAAPAMVKTRLPTENSGGENWPEIKLETPL